MAASPRGPGDGAPDGAGTGTVLIIDDSAGLEADAVAGGALVAGARDEILSRLSHELRTSLNAVLGFAQLLELTELSEHHRAALDHLLGAGRHLIDLVDEALDSSRIEARGFEPPLEPAGLGSVVDDGLALARASAGAPAEPVDVHRLLTVIRGEEP